MGRDARNRREPDSQRPLKQSVRCCSLPRVEHRGAGCFKVCDVARHDRHPMD
jgi:hypothetical protein